MKPAFLKRESSGISSTNPEEAVATACAVEMRRSAVTGRVLGIVAVLSWLGVVTPSCDADPVFPGGDFPYTPSIPDNGLKKGTITFTITLSNGNTIPATVNIDPADIDNISQKVESIKSQLASNSKGPLSVGDNGGTVGTPSAVLINASQTDPTTKQVVSVECVKISDTTGEPMDKLKMQKDPSGLQVLVGFTGTLAGTDVGGAPAIYTGGFGYDGLMVQSQLTYASLPVKTVSGLLTTMYQSFLSQLPTGLQSDLVLDLPDQSILFNAPDNVNNPYVIVGSTDTGVTTICQVCLPEPSSIIPGCTGLLTVLGLLVRRSKAPLRARKAA